MNWFTKKVFFRFYRCWNFNLEFTFVRHGIKARLIAGGATIDGLRERISRLEDFLGTFPSDLFVWSNMLQTLMLWPRILLLSLL